MTPPLAIGQITIIGHSYWAEPPVVAGVMYSEQMPGSLIADALGARLFNLALSGTCLTGLPGLPGGLNTNGGWGRYLQNMPGQLPGVSPFPQPVDPARSPLLIIGHGINDVTYCGAGRAQAYVNAVLTVIRAARAAVQIENDAAIVAHTGGVTEAKTDRNSGAGTRAFTANGQTIINGAPLNACPGGEAVVRVVMNTGAAGSVKITCAGSSTTVDLTAAGQINPLASEAGPLAIPVTLPANPGQMTLDWTVGAGKIEFDTVTLTGGDGPLVLIANAARLPDYTVYNVINTSSGLFAISDATVAEFNAQVAQIPNLFPDGSVQILDVDSLLAKNPALFEPGGIAVHPNAAGNELIAQTAVDLIPAQTARRIVRTSSRASGWQAQTLAANWTNVAGFNPLAARIGPDGMVRMRGRIRKSTVALSAGETAATLPAQLRPTATLRYVIAGDTGPCTFDITPAGQILYQSGGTLTTGFFDLAGIPPFTAGL